VKRNKAPESVAVANYSKGCEVCKQLPTVDIHTQRLRKGVTVKQIHSTGMCGVCLWGEADLRDPDNW